MSGKVPKQNLPPCRIYSGICQVHLLTKKYILPRPVLGTVRLTYEVLDPKGSRHKAGKEPYPERSRNKSAKLREASKRTKKFHRVNAVGIVIYCWLLRCSKGNVIMPNNALDFAFVFCEKRFQLFLAFVLLIK